ncbi:MAG TPA: PspC domain-containing protein [Clostridiales bacterium]|nr:PspC domain-containing protein [Clostridiales bacterium]
MSKKLYRSARQCVIAGVCGGIAEYLNVDVTIVRLIWVLSLFLGGAGVPVYIIAAIIIPKDENQSGTIVVDENGNETFVPDESSNMKNNTLLLAGIAMIVIGGMVLVNEFFPFREILRQLRGYFLPAILIIAGFLIIFSSLRKK